MVFLAISGEFPCSGRRRYQPEAAPVRGFRFPAGRMLHAYAGLGSIE